MVSAFSSTEHIKLRRNEQLLRSHSSNYVPALSHMPVEDLKTFSLQYRDTFDSSFRRKSSNVELKSTHYLKMFYI
jgi:hypothetical protein